MKNLMIKVSIEVKRVAGYGESDILAISNITETGDVAEEEVTCFLTRVVEGARHRAVTCCDRYLDNRKRADSPSDSEGTT